MGCGCNDKTPVTPPNTGIGSGVTNPCLPALPDYGQLGFVDKCNMFTSWLNDLTTRFNNCPQYYTRDDFTKLIQLIKAAIEQMCNNDKILADLLPQILTRIKLIENLLMSMQSIVNNIQNIINQGGGGNGGCGDGTYLAGTVIENGCLGLPAGTNIGGLTRCQVIDLLLSTANTNCGGTTPEPEPYDVPTLDGVTTQTQGTVEVGQTINIVGNWTGNYWTNVLPNQNGKKWKVEVLNPNGQVVSTEYTDGGSYMFTAISLSVAGKYCVRVTGVGKKGENLTHSSCDATGDGGIIVGGGTTTYWNVAKSGTATKNNCGSGQTGSTVTYTVAAHTYSSTVSQADADNQAQANVDANKQSYANANGTCSGGTTTYWNVAKSATATKNNCPSGQSGSTETFTITAHTYSSTVSQADADAQAQAAATAGAQANANSVGTCTINPPDTYTITMSHGTGGSTNPAAGSYSRAAGSYVHVEFNPDNGYEIDTLTIDGVNITPIITFKDWDNLNANHTVNVTFKPIAATTFTISYDSQGGNPVAGSPFTVAQGGTHIIQNATRTGYTLDGWADTPTGTANTFPGGSLTVTANRTFYAKWTAVAVDKVTITYADGAQGLDNTIAGMPSPLSVQIDKNSNYTVTSTVPTRYGYVFVNWAATGGKTGQFASGASMTSVGADVTLTANWGAVPYEYKINLDGGALPGGNVGSGATMPGDVGFGMPVKSPTNTPTKSGMVFQGWQDTATSNKVFEGTQTSFNFTMPARVVEVKAIWGSAIKYTVSYNGNGGTDVPVDNNQYDAGDTVTIKSYN